MKANTTKQQVLASLFLTHVQECDSDIKDVEVLLQELEIRIARTRKAHMENRPFKVQMECVEMMAVMGKAYLQTS